VINMIKCLAIIDEQYSGRVMIVQGWCHIRVMYISACVVDRPFNAPNWRGPNLPTVFAKMHRPTNDSGTLLKVGVREIGLKSS
jgi:hypothetical protein